MAAVLKQKLRFSDLKLTQLNRAEVDNRHVDELAELIKKFGYLEYLPILALTNGSIIEGQHRFLACKKLGIECSLYS